MSSDARRFRAESTLDFGAGGNRTHGAAMLLEKGGTGQAATVIGLLPLRWSVEDNELLSVRYSAGDGFVIYEKYEPNKTSNTLDRVSYRSVYLNEDHVEREDNVRVACLVTRVIEAIGTRACPI